MSVLSDLGLVRGRDASGRGRLARRLIVAVVLFSSLITLAATALQLYLDYRRDFRNIGIQFQQIRSANLGSLIESVWVLDEVQVQTQLDGLLRLPDMEYLAIRIDGRVRWQAGIAGVKYEITEEFPLVRRHRGRDVAIGTLTAKASLQGVYRRLLDKAVVILVSNAIKTFLVAGFILIIFHHLVTRHLDTMSTFFRELGRSLKTPALRLARQTGRRGAPDELEEMVAAINQMRADLETSYMKRRRSEERFRAIAESSPVALVITRAADGAILYANAKIEPILGLSRAALRGRKIGDFIADTEQAERWAARLDGDGFGAEAPLEMRRTDGRRVATVHSMQTISYADTEAVLGCFQDVTERLRLEDQLRQSQKMEAVGQLTGGVAHDFNNLLTVISGNLELLLEHPGIEPALARNLQNAFDAAATGAELTRRLLAFSRKQTLDPKAVHLDRLVHGMMDMLSRTLGETIEVKVASVVGQWPCLADPGQLESALLNLCVNSRDAMPEGGILSIETANRRFGAGDGALSVEVGSVEVGSADVEPGDYVMLAVRDTGVGIAPEVLDRVFEPFYTSKDVGAGTGLGLSMVFGFAKQSGGHVTIESEPGQGTTVTLYLPRATQGVETVSAAGVAMPKAGAAAAETVLVVEDNPGLLELALNMLDALGYRALAAPNGTMALGLLARKPEIDLLLTDVILPGGISGPQLAAKSKALLPGLKVLFMSGYAENAFAHHAEFDEEPFLMQKPFRKAELALRVREALDGSA